MRAQRTAGTRGAEQPPGAEEARCHPTARSAPFALRRRGGRDAMLVIAAEPLRGELVELGRREQLDVHVCTTPLAACQALVHEGDRIAYAIIASDPLWGIGLRQLLVDEHPAIQTIMVVA